MRGRNSNRIITGHGGIIPVVKKLKDLGVPKLIRDCLPPRKHNALYGHEDAFIAWSLSQMCGATRLAQIMEQDKWKKVIPDLKVPSHDTLGRIMKNLSTKNKTAKSVGHSSTPGTYTVNENLPLNRMLVKTTKRVGALSEKRSYTLDIDALFIATTRKEAARKQDEEGNLIPGRIGFNPMICLIGDMPVFVSMRNGDANARLNIHKCLSDCLGLLDESKIKIGRVISDAAGYNKKAMAMLDERGIIFNMRFPHMKMMKTFNMLLRNHEDWRETKIETANFTWNCEIADIPYVMWKSANPNPYRVVVVRVPTDEFAKHIYNKEQLRKQRDLKREYKKLLLKEGSGLYDEGKWKEIDGYKYKFIITNDFQRLPEQLMIEYNHRGTSERQFSFMKQDFGWRMPPFCKMKHNTVFLIASALANNIFRAMVRIFIGDVPGMKFSQRLKEFIKNFILVACEYINGEVYEFSNSKINYEKIMS